MWAEDEDKKVDGLDLRDNQTEEMITSAESEASYRGIRVTSMFRLFEFRMLTE